MPNKDHPRRRAFLVDVEIVKRKKSGFTDIHVPIPDLGIYQPHEGVWQAICGTTEVPSELVKLNKTQPNDGSTLGVAELDDQGHYKVRYKSKYTESIHEDYHTETKVFTGRQLRIWNENYGRPAETRYQKELAKEAAKSAPGTQLSLFDEIPVDTPSTMIAIDLADEDFEW